MPSLAGRIWGFPKMVGFPPISHPNGWSFLVGKAIVVGYHHFRKYPYIIYYISYVQKHVWEFCVCFCCWCCCCSYWWWWRILPNSQSKYCITLVQSYFAEVNPTNVPRMFPVLTLRVKTTTWTASKKPSEDLSCSSAKSQRISCIVPRRSCATTKTKLKHSSKCLDLRILYHSIPI